MINNTLLLEMNVIQLTYDLPLLEDNKWHQNNPKKEIWKNKNVNSSINYYKQ